MPVRRRVAICSSGGDMSDLRSSGPSRSRIWSTVSQVSSLNFFEIASAFAKSPNSRVVTPAPDVRNLLAFRVIVREAGHPAASTAYSMSMNRGEYRGRGLPLATARAMDRSLSWA